MTFYQLIEHLSLFNYNEKHFLGARENGTLTYALSHSQLLLRGVYITLSLNSPTLTPIVCARNSELLSCMTMKCTGSRSPDQAHLSYSLIAFLISIIFIRAISRENPILFHANNKVAG